MKPVCLLLSLLFAITASVDSCLGADDQPFSQSAIEGFVFCSEPARDQPVPIYVRLCRKRQVGSLNCGEKVEVLSRHDDMLRIASSERLPRFVLASAISRHADKFVPFDNQSGVPDRGAPNCAQLAGQRVQGFVFCSDRQETAPVYLSPCQTSASSTLACGEKIVVLTRQGDRLQVALPPDDLRRYMAASAVSQDAGKFVPFDDDSGVPDKGARACQDRPERDITPPHAIFTPPAEFSDQARKKKVQGVVVVSLTVGVDGTAHDITVDKGLGYGLDEKAVEAVSRWKFKPALKDGETIERRIVVEVSFHLY